MKTPGHPKRAAFSLLELLLSLSLLGGVLLVITSTVDREQRVLDALASRTNDVVRGQHLIGRIDDILRRAQGTLPDAWLAEAVDGTTTSRLTVDTTLGFPDHGTVILEPGSSREESIRYESLRAGADPRFLDLTRGEQCTDGDSHPEGSAVLWSGTAFAIADQSGPPPSAYNGRSLERGEEVFFRGHGQGFSFRVPIDPTSARTKGRRSAPGRSTAKRGPSCVPGTAGGSACAMASGPTTRGWASTRSRPAWWATRCR